MAMRVKGEHQTGRTGGNAPVEVMHRRVLVCTILIVGFFCLLALRLWQVQVLQGPEHLRRAQRQSVRFVRLNSVRGRIFVDGQAVVDNQAHYDLVFYVSEMRQPGRQTNTIQYVLETERALSEYLGREATLDAGQVQRQLNRQPVLPMTVMRDLTPKELSAIAERLPVIPGVDVQPRVERVHPFPGLLTHLLGYTGRDQPNPDELSEDYPRAYTMMELTGRNGLERAFAKTLEFRVRVKPCLGTCYFDLKDISGESLFYVFITEDGRMQLNSGEKVSYPKAKIQEEWQDWIFVINLQKKALTRVIIEGKAYVLSNFLVSGNGYCECMWLKDVGEKGSYFKMCSGMYPKK